MNGTCQPESDVLEQIPASIVDTTSKPSITTEEDIPFAETVPLKEKAEVVKGLRQQEHEHDVDNKKLAVGKALLYVCLGGIFVLTLVDVFAHPESDILTNAVDLGKTVATIVLGYLFGSSSKTSS